MGDLNSDTNSIYTVMQIRLKCYADEAKKQIKDRSAKYTLDLNEEKTMSFEWFLSDDETEATLMESFKDSDGAKQRVENLFASPIAAERMERFDLTNMILAGNVKQDLIELLTPRGAKFLRYAGGFNHRQINQCALF